MRKLALLFFSCIISLSNLHADLLSLDEQLITFSLKKGIEVWLKQYVTTPPSIACRFISHDPLQGKPQIFDLDCPADLFEDELPGFLEYCEDETQKQGGAFIGLISVGSMDVQGLKQFLMERYQNQSKEEDLSYETIQLFPSKETQYIDLCLSYPTTLSPIQTEQDVKKLWVFYLIQSMAEERFKQAAVEAGGDWVDVVEAKRLLPAMATVGHGIDRNARGSIRSQILVAFLQAIQTLKERGFTENELADSKSKLQKHLEYFNRASPDHLTMADYYASYLSAGLPCPDYAAFMEHSFRAISKIEMADIAEMLKASFLDETRCVAARFPENTALSQENIQQTLDHYSSNSVVYQEPTRIDLVEGKDAFSQLPLTDEEQKMIRQVIQTVAKTNPVRLGFMYSELEKKREQLIHIHPLRSVAVFVSDPYTKQCLAEIMGSIVKAPSFISDFSKRMKQEADKNNLMVYVPGFCQAVKANPDQVRLHINNKDYEGLIKYLIRLKNQG